MHVCRAYFSPKKTLEFERFGVTAQDLRFVKAFIETNGFTAIVMVSVVVVSIVAVTVVVVSIVVVTVVVVSIIAISTVVTAIVI